MARRSLSSLLPEIYDAAIHPEAWRSVMRSISRLTGALGGGYVVLSKRTNRVIDADAVGITEGLAEDYIRHYSPSDPYLVRMDRADKEWFLLSTLKAEVDLSHNEWYNDFICKNNIAELAVMKLAETDRLIAAIGFEYGAELSNGTLKALQELKEPLARAALLDMEMRYRGWQAKIAGDVVGHLSIGVIIINDSGRIIEINPVAERIISRSDGIKVREFRIALGRAFEASKFEAYLAAVLSGRRDTNKIARMLVGRPGGKRPYTVTVVPSRRLHQTGARTYAILLISDPDIEMPTEADLAELFGLSAAESRLAIALLEGKALPEIAAAAGVKIRTLRTQMQSIYRKVGVERQSELLLTLSQGFRRRRVR